MYGRVRNYPHNTVEAAEAVVASPTAYWMTIKQLEPRTPEGALSLLVKEPKKFWEAVKLKYDKQKAEVGGKAKWERRPSGRVGQVGGEVRWEGVSCKALIPGLTIACGFKKNVECDTRYR